jgi:tetraacyldisaccharide 4'-kinase
MRREEDSRWARLVRGEARGVWDNLATLGLSAASKVYGAALRLHHAGYRVGMARRTRLPATVISIGNLTLGGTGKTVAAIAVARWLSERGRRVAVLSRGYRGEAERRGAVVSEGFGPLVGVTESGDEPYLMARTLPGVFVLAGKDRRRTGRWAVADLGADTLVLDDGFQYQRLVKDHEVVLVDALEPFGYHFLVPRGLLREPLRHLARADAVWITHSDLVRERDLQDVRARVEELAPAARIWESVHAPVRLRPLAGEGERDPRALHGRSVVALSSLGNPAAFERGLEKLGAVVVERARFPDHHGYRAEDLQQLSAEGGPRSDWIVTTQKDAVRLPRDGLDRPVWILEIALAGRAGGPTLSEELSCLLGAGN